MDNEGFSYRALTAAGDRAGKGADDEIGQLVRSLRWDDGFFAEEDGLVAVFDFDYDKIASFNKSVACAAMLFPPVLILGSLCGYPCLFRRNIDWDVRSQHVAVTRDGIKYVKDRRRTGCGCPCQDAGRVSKTVPFDKITDCDVQEPAGATCCCIENVLSVVSVDTASSGGGGGEGASKELALAGLREPHKLKKLVWAMKRATSGGRAVPTAAQAASPSVAVGSMAMERGGGNEETNALLRDIRGELIEMNANIKKMNA